MPTNPKSIKCVGTNYAMESPRYHCHWDFMPSWILRHVDDMYVFVYYLFCILLTIVSPLHYFFVVVIVIVIVVVVVVVVCVLVAHIHTHTYTHPWIFILSSYSIPFVTLISRSTTHPFFVCIRLPLLQMFYISGPRVPSSVT